MSPDVMSSNQTSVRRWMIVGSALVGVAIGIVLDILAAAILFRRYSFFESVVICLLVMILCTVATMRADFEPGGFLQQYKDADAASMLKESESDLLLQVRAHLKVFFYGIALIMALIKLVLTLIDNL